MEAMLAYLLKVSVSAILFYLFIRILMERETQHEYIRGLWVGAIVFSLVLPFIYVSILYVVSFIRLYIRIKRTPRAHEYDSILRRCAEESGCSRNVRLRVTDDSTAGPYSWMRNIVICRQDMECDGKDIILHHGSYSIPFAKSMNTVQTVPCSGAGPMHVNIRHC